MKSTFTILLGIALGIGGFFISHHEAGQVPGAITVENQKTIVENAQAFILPPSQANYVPIRDFGVPEPIFNARSALLVDGQSGRVLFAKNPDQRLPIASITKLMTALVVLENMDLSKTYTVTAEDLNLDGNGADFRAGEQLHGTELLKIMLVESSNDAASVFATTAYRQGIDFVGLMNTKAASLGMAGTHFSDPAGLNDVESYSTASDVVKLVRAAMKYALLRDIATSSSLDVPTLSGTLYHVINTNELLSIIPRILLGKTGNTDGALGTLALAVSLDEDQYLIGVVLGTTDRFGEMKQLIDWGKKAHRWN